MSRSSQGQCLKQQAVISCIHLAASQRCTKYAVTPIFTWQCTPQQGIRKCQLQSHILHFLEQQSSMAMIWICSDQMVSDHVLL